MTPAVILGMGVVSAAGRNLDETQGNLYRPPVMPRPSRRVKSQLGLPVFELDGLEFFTPGGYTMMLLLNALEEALKTAGLDEHALRDFRIGTAIGSTVACQLNSIPFYQRLRNGEKPPAEVLRSCVDGSPAEYIRRRYRLNGPALTVANACTSGADAIGIGCAWLESGVCDLAIVGGADEINQVPLAGFNALGVFSKYPCRPFDREREGLNLGEAGGVLILAGPKFGSKSALSVAGFGKSSDAWHITQPDPEAKGLERAVKTAFDSAGIHPGDVGFINAHGTGTLPNDLAEAKLFERLWPEGIAYHSTKALTGHTLGAAGAVEAIFTALMLERGTVAPSWGFCDADPEMAFPPSAEEFSFSQEFALSTSLAFGGSNTAVLIGRNRQ